MFFKHSHVEKLFILRMGLYDYVCPKKGEAIASQYITYSLVSLLGTQQLYCELSDKRNIA